MLANTCFGSPRSDPSPANQSDQFVSNMGLAWHPTGARPRIASMGLVAEMDHSLTTIWIGLPGRLNNITNF